MPGSPSSGLPRRFGDYELEEEIGGGAFGVVYRARHLPLDRLVAVKIIRSGCFATAEERRRFRIEAEAAANLEHPNIVSVFEVGEHAGWPFLAMRLVNGKSLAQRLQSKAGTEAVPGQARLTFRESAALLTTVARAVAHAHHHGVFHRDLKPANVLLDDSGQPHLTDFGLAKWLRRDRDHTQSQAFLGTPPYMSPEQAAGHSRDVTVASDVFSLGAILYELLCGRPPFTGQTNAETLQRVVEANPIWPRAVNSLVDRDLETVCLKCLEPEPSRRYESADALANDLERWQRHEPILARPTGLFEKGRKWVRRKPALAGLLAVLSVVLVGGITATLWQYVLAQRARAEVQGAAMNAKVQLSREALAKGTPHDALALLAEVVRQRPDLQVARDGLLAELSHRHFPLPVVELPPSLGTVGYLRFSPDGRFLATACADGTANLWDTLTNGRACAPLRHGNEVYCVAFSPDGGRLATASIDKTARIWELPSGRLLTTIQHTGAVQTVCFSPDGQSLATASLDQTARLSDARSGATLFQVRTDSGGLKDARFSPDGALLLTVADAARLWDARTGESKGTPLTNQAAVSLARFSPRGERVLTASADGFLRLWETASTSLLKEWVAHNATVHDIEFSPDGTRVVSTSADNTARLWDPDKGEAVGPPMVHTRWVDFARFSPDGSKVVTGTRDDAFRVWDLTNRTLWCTPMRGRGFTMAAAFSPDGQRLATASAFATPVVWDLRPGAAQPLVLVHTAAVTRAEFDLHGARVVSASYDGTARVWDAFTGGALTPPLVHTGVVNIATLSPDGTVILTASEDRSARLWDSATGQPRCPALWHTGAVPVACFDPRGERFATACTDGHARVWDVRTAQLLRELRWDSPDRPWKVPISSAQFTPDGQTLVLGCMDNTVRVWDLTDTNSLAEVRVRRTGPVVAIAVSSDGKRIAGASWDFDAFLADLATGQLLAPALRHQDMIFHVAFNHDGRAFATSGYDAATRLWNGRTGAAVAAPLRHSQLVYWSDFSSNGLRVATSSMDGTAQVWDSHTGLPIGPPLKHEGAVRSVRFNPDGQRIVTACDDGKARIWDVPSPADPPPDWVPALAEALAGQRVDTDGVIHDVPISEFLRLRAQLLANSGTNLWSRWGRWFASDRSSRPSSPFAEPAH